MNNQQQYIVSAFLNVIDEVRNSNDSTRHAIPDVQSLVELISDGGGGGGNISRSSLLSQCSKWMGFVSLHNQPP